VWSSGSIHRDATDDMDGLLGSLLSDDATRGYLKAEILAKPMEILEAQRTSPSPRIPFNMPNPQPAV
jgi:hypothetical protein